MNIFRRHLRVTLHFIWMTVTRERITIGLQNRQVRKNDLEATEVMTVRDPLEQTGTHEVKQLLSVSHCCQTWQIR